MRRRNAPTLKDVADEAGVSAMMASVVLNGAQSSTRVASATRERILAVAARLQYRRNAVARGLSRQRMDAIGVIAIIDGGEMNFYILELLNGVLEAAALHGQNTTIFSLASWLNDSHKLLNFCDGRVDGMILIAPEIQDPEKLSHHTPFVTIHGNESAPATFNLCADNEGGAYAVTRFLIEQGHRSIVHFTGTPTALDTKQRVQGFRRALVEAGLPCEDTNLIYGNFSAHSGHQRMAEMLDRAGTLPTAIFCGSDAIAAGCMDALADRGLRVPEDISIAGFDDTFLARMTRPSLTTVRQPFRQMGRCAVEKLLTLINSHEETAEADAAERFSLGGAYTDAHTQIFPTDLVVRETVGPPPG